MKRIAILHYASAPVVGGVEATITQHARGLTRLGYAVRVVSGSGASFDPAVEVRVNPRFGSRDADVLRIKAELDAGRVPPDLEALVGSLKDDLWAALAGCDVCIAHNVPTLNKNLPLTLALLRLAEAGDIRLIAWCHDLAWTNPQYLPELHPGYPWHVLRLPWPNTRYVTVSEARQRELAELMGLPLENIRVIVPGVDPAQFFGWTETTCALERRLHLLDADGLLLVPARLTRRKNIELALRILAELQRLSRRDFRLIVTGPPGPHNPTNPGYLGELLALRDELALAETAHFLYEYGVGDDPLIPDDATMANLYLLSDALLFPSVQEGFGMPILEAGLAGLLVFCADLAPLRQSGQDDAFYFNPVGEPPAEIAARLLLTLDSNPSYRLRMRVRQQYRWDAILRERLLPLLEEL